MTIEEYGDNMQKAPLLTTHVLSQIKIQQICKCSKIGKGEYEWEWVRLYGDSTQKISLRTSHMLSQGRSYHQQLTKSAAHWQAVSLETIQHHVIPTWQI